MAGGAESPAERIARLIAEGRMPAEAVSEAERLWRERLANGVRMPNGETARVELSDLHHLIVDPRIWRHPERIARLLEGIFEIREADKGRRCALSGWTEDEAPRLGYAILGPDSQVRTMHLIGARDVERLRRRGGLLSLLCWFRRAGRCHS